MRLAVVALISGVAACGGGGSKTPVPVKPAQPTQPVAGDKPPVADKPAAPAGKPTCAVAAVALVKERGFGKIPSANQERARRAGEAEAEASCLDDQWEPAAIECMSTRPSPASCLGQLDEYQQHSYEAHFGGWELNWTKGVSARNTGHGLDDPQDDPDPPGKDPTADAKPPHEEWIPCESSIGDVASYEPQIKPKAPDRDYALKVRKSSLIRTCEYKWSNTDKKCFGATKDAASIAACRGKLDTAGQNSVVNSLADAETKFQRVIKLSKDAKATACKTVAATYYSGEVTNNRLTSLAPTERTRVIAESRDRLAAACTKDKWRPAERACITLATNEYAMSECFETGGYEKAFKFRLPAAGVVFKVGIPECDELGDQIKKISTCDKLEKELRDMLLDSFSMQLGSWAEVRAADRAEIGELCKDSGKRYLDRAKRAGCTL